MNAKTVNDILDVLAARFGTTTAHLWGVLVRQVYVDAGMAVVLLALSAIAAAVMISSARAAIKRQRASFTERGWRWDESNAFDVWQAIVAILLVIVTTVLLLVAIYQVAQTLNPEYGALQSVLHALRGGT